MKAMAAEDYISLPAMLEEDETRPLCHSFTPRMLGTIVRPKTSSRKQQPRPAISVPTPSRRRTRGCLRFAQAVKPPAIDEPATDIEECPEPLRCGDEVFVTRDFMSISLVRVQLRKGWCGSVVRVDQCGDALVLFKNHVKLQWVMKRNLAYLRRERLTPPDTARGSSAVASCSSHSDNCSHSSTGKRCPDADAVHASAEQSLAPNVCGSRSGFPVWIHVYDLGHVSRWVLNSSWPVRHHGFGAFHCGVEVLGIEFSFQAVSNRLSDNDPTSGITWHNPKSHTRHVYRESIELGETPLGLDEIATLLEELEREWLARDYHCLRRNCTDFAERLALALKVPEPFPQWVHGLAKGLLGTSPYVVERAKVFSCSSSCSPCSSSCKSLPVGTSVAALTRRPSSVKAVSINTQDDDLEDECSTMVGKCTVLCSSCSVGN